jgi:hypothetical protein
MRFYSIKSKRVVEVPNSKVTYRTTANGRKQAVAKTADGETVYKFVKG